MSSGSLALDIALVLVVIQKVGSSEILFQNHLVKQPLPSMQWHKHHRKEGHCCLYRCRACLGSILCSSSWGQYRRTSCQPDSEGTRLEIAGKSTLVRLIWWLSTLLRLWYHVRKSMEISRIATLVCKSWMMVSDARKLRLRSIRLNHCHLYQPIALKKLGNACLGTLKPHLVVVLTNSRFCPFRCSFGNTQIKGTGTKRYQRW